MHLMSRGTANISVSMKRIAGRKSALVARHHRLEHRCE